MFLNPGNVLSWATFFPLIGAAAIVVLLAVRGIANLPKKLVDDGARLIALATSGLSFVAAIAAWRMYDPTDTGVQLAHHFVWIRAFNIEYYVGVDGLSISMVLLSGLISFIATIASMPWWSGARAARWPAWSRTTATGTTTRTTRSTSRCGWCPATWSCCCSCRPA